MDALRQLPPIKKRVASVRVTKLAVVAGPRSRRGGQIAVTMSARRGHSSGARVWLCVLAVVGSVLAVAPTAAAQAGSYEDVAEGAYYAGPVAALREAGVFAGTLCASGFCPGEPIDRETMAVWVVRVLDGRDPAPVSQSRFDDVDAGSFHAPFIERMAELEVTTGCGDGSGYCPDRNVTRAEMAAFISRAYDLPDGPDPGFSDVPPDAWYAADVARLAASKITVGCGDGTRFCPGRDTTRAHMATFLARATGVVDLPTSAASKPKITGDLISISGTHGCAVRTDRTITCWGDNAYGQASPPAGEFAAVAVGHWYSCALRTDGSVACWGDNLDGRTDAPDGTYTDLAAAPRHPCALHTDATIRCWGRGHTQYPGGQLTYRPPSGTFTDISLSDDLGCAIRTDQSIACWGWVRWLNRNDTTPTGRFIAVDTHPRTHACALRSDLTITCWGANNGSALDAPDGAHLSVVTGRRHSCALKPDRTITCWGDQDDPQQVGGAHAVRSYGLADPPEGKFRAIAATDWQTCALRDNNTHTCWGHNAFIWGGDVEPPPTELEPLSGEILRQHIKANIIDQYSTDHPWLLEAWKFIDSSNFQYAIGLSYRAETEWYRRSWRPTNTGSDNPMDSELNYPIASAIFIPDATYLSADHDSFYIRQLAQIYVISANVRFNPVPLAIAHLHFNQHRNLWERAADCIPARLIEEVLVHIIMPNEPLTQWSNCSSLPDIPDRESLAIVNEALAGQIPESFSLEFTTQDGKLDHGRIWRCLIYYHCERYTAQVVADEYLIYQLRNAFGGYCSNQHVASYSRFELELQIEHPWRDGGCEDPSPKMTTGLKTASNLASRAAKAVVEEFRASNPWIQTAWEMTNRPDYKYIPVVRPYAGLRCPGPRACVAPRESMVLSIGEYANTFEFINPPTELMTFSEPRASTIAHELAHDLTMVYRDIPQAPTIAIGWLYFRSLSSSLGSDYDYSGWEHWCLPEELYASAADTLVDVQPPYLWIPSAFNFCLDLDSHSEEALSVARDSLNGTRPAWFYDEFGLSDGRIDYVALWQRVAEFPSYPVVPQFGEAFGGYCFSIDEIRRTLARGTDLPEGADQPWVDGGCPN